ncbi:MAG: ubiquitin-like protein Pup [Ilumatobacteraceae bacterium]
MAERIRKHKPTPEHRDESKQGDQVVGTSGVKLKAELDELLDEIDGVLESNAEDFVKSYVQKGGQ